MRPTLGNAIAPKTPSLLRGGDHFDEPHAFFPALECVLVQMVSALFPHF
jgi:hypothetical protein